MTKIKYTAERLNGSLKMGKIFIGIGLFFVLLSFAYKDWQGLSPLAIGVGEIGGGVFMFCIYFYLKKKQYLTVENNEIKKHTLFGDKIELSKITEVKEFAGDILLKTEKGQFTINTQIIEEGSLNELREILSKIPVQEVRAE